MKESNQELSSNLIPEEVASDCGNTFERYYIITIGFETKMCLQ